jgi:hypothetical protein
MNKYNGLLVCAMGHSHGKTEKCLALGRLKVTVVDKGKGKIYL